MSAVLLVSSVRGGRLILRLYRDGDLGSVCKYLSVNFEFS